MSAPPSGSSTLTLTLALTLTLPLSSTLTLALTLPSTLPLSLTSTLALKPCCLPDRFFARRGDVFAASNGHAFPAAAVAVDGRWQRGKWVGSAAL